MISLHAILATVTASEELPDFWHHIALVSFLAGATLSVVLLVAAFLLRNRRSWFIPTCVVALVAGGLALAFMAYVYKIDQVALRPEGSEGASSLWQSFSVPCLPLIISLGAMVIYRKRTSAT